MSGNRGDVDVRIGGRVRAARLAANVSQAKLGETLGLTFQQVQKYEKGSSRLNVAALQRIAERLGVPAASFLDPEHQAGRNAAAPSPAGAAKDAEIAQALSLLEHPELRRSLIAVAKLVSEASNDA